MSKEIKKDKKTTKINDNKKNKEKIKKDNKKTNKLDNKKTKISENKKIKKEKLKKEVDLNLLKKRFKVIGIICLTIVLIELIIMLIMHLTREDKIVYIDTLYSIENINNDYYLAAGSSNFKYSNYNETSIYEYQDSIQKDKINRVYAEKAKLVKYDSELNVVFEKTFKSDYDSIFYDAIVANNSIYAVGSYVYEEKQLSLNTRDGLFAKYDLEGNFLWSKNYQVLGDTEFKKLIEVEDGLILVGQSIYENMEIGNHTQGGGIIVKYDFDGNIIWVNNFGGNKSGIFEDVIQVSDGYIVCGKDASNYGMLVKFDLDGKRLWVKNYANTDTIGNHSIDIKDDKIYIASAYNKSEEKDSEGNIKFEYDACIFVYDLNGELLDTYTIGGNAEDRFNSLLLLDDKIIAVGYTKSSDIKIDNLKYSKDKAEGMIVEYDYEGKIINKKVYSGKNNETLNDIILSIPSTADKINNTKSYVVVGYTNSKRDLFTGNNKDYFSKVIRYDEKLELLEEK